MSILKQSIEVNLTCCETLLFDYIVIGTGASGGATALTLSEKNPNLNILVIEAGPLVLTEHIGSLSVKHNPPIIKELSQRCSGHVSWNSNEAEYKEQVWTVAGGRTLFWGGHSPRFFDFEFNDWPIPFTELNTDYEWAEARLYVGKNFFSNEIAQQIIDQCLYNDICVEESPLALEHKSNESILPHLLSSSISALIRDKQFTNNAFNSGIHLLCDTKAYQLIHKNGHIEGIQVINTKDNSNHILRANRYILACGAFRSTKLVIDSGLKIESSLFKKGIGEHLFCKGLIRLDEPLNKPIYLYVPAQEPSRFMFELQGPFKKTWYDANHATIWLDWQRNNKYLLLYGFGVAEVSSDNTIESSIVDSFYKIKFNHTYKDYQTMEQMKEKAIHLAKSLHGELIDIEFQPPGSSLHERGGLVMSNNEKDGVVSPQGRFWHYDNLYCTDSAVWPNQGAANSYLNIYTIAHHLTKKLT